MRHSEGRIVRRDTTDAEDVRSPEILNFCLHENGRSGVKTMDYKFIANEGHTIGANLDDGRTMPTKMKLVKHYLPSAWGIAFILPALLVPPSYRESIGFHISLTVAWLYWIFAMYQIENTFKKLAPDSSVLPKRAWLVSFGNWQPPN